MGPKTVNAIFVLGGTMGAMALVEQTIELALEKSINLEQFLANDLPDLELSQMTFDETADIIQTLTPPISLTLTLALRQCQKVAEQLTVELWEKLLGTTLDLAQTNKDDLRRLANDIQTRPLSTTLDLYLSDQDHLRKLARALQSSILTLGGLVQE